MRAPVYLTAPQVARRKDVTPEAVIRAIKEGRLQATVWQETPVYRRYLITLEAMNAWEPRPGHRRLSRAATANRRQERDQRRWSARQRFLGLKAAQWRGWPAGDKEKGKR